MDLTWPDLEPKISQNVRNECPLKVRKFQLFISSRLARAEEKSQGGSLRPSPARNRLNVQLKHEKDGHITRRINDNWPNCLSNRYRNYTHKQLKWNSLTTTGPFVLHFDERRRRIFAIKISIPKRFVCTLRHFEGLVAKHLTLRHSEMFKPTTSRTLLVYFITMVTVWTVMSLF